MFASLIPKDVSYFYHRCIDHPLELATGCSVFLTQLMCLFVERAFIWCDFHKRGCESRIQSALHTSGQERPPGIRKVGEKGNSYRITLPSPHLCRIFSSLYVFLCLRHGLWQVASQ